MANSAICQTNHEQLVNRKKRDIKAEEKSSSSLSLKNALEPIRKDSFAKSRFADQIFQLSNEQEAPSQNFISSYYQQQQQRKLLFLFTNSFIEARVKANTQHS